MYHGGKVIRRSLIKGQLRTMPGDMNPWDPNDWEKHIQKVLKVRYSQPVGSYQHIAADIKGDCGLEGFALDGTAYQCYACQNWNDFGILLTHQKNKMTADIGKLLRKEAELMAIMGDIRICIWNFVLPFWNDKDLLKHARKKEDEVRKKGPKHVTPDFRISVITGDEFAIETRSLAKQDLYQFDVKGEMPDSVAAVAKWFEDNTGLEIADNLNRKSAIIANGKSEDMRKRFLNRIVTDFTYGQVILGKLELDFPEIFEDIIQRKTAREVELDSECLTNTSVPGEFFNATLTGYKSQLKSVRGISPHAANLLAREAVADWLLRCPLEFE
jgi:hypothetical protein